MKIRRVLILGAALLGSFAVSAGLMGGLAPFDSAGAEPADVPQSERLTAALRHSEPGAVVTLKEDGGYSIVGRRTPSVAHQQLDALSRGGPQSVRCDANGEQFMCVPMADRLVLDALKRGETVYGRAVYAGIPQGSRTTPMLTPDELICGESSLSGSMSCVRASDATPKIAADATALVTYTPFRVRFEGDRTIGLPQPATIAVERRSN